MYSLKNRILVSSSACQEPSWVPCMRIKINISQHGLKKATFEESEEESGSGELLVQPAEAAHLSQDAGGIQQEGTRGSHFMYSYTVH